MEEIAVEKMNLKSFKSRLIKTQLEKLNKNLLNYVFEYLNVKEILKCTMVCKTFNEITLKYPILAKYFEVFYIFNEI